MLGRSGSVAAQPLRAGPAATGGPSARVGARTLLHFVFGHTADEQTHLQAGSAGAIPDDPREQSGFVLGLDLIVDGLRARLLATR